MQQNDWKIQNNELCKTFVFADFTSAISWMVKAAFIIEKHNHHPSWTNTYNKVEVNLCTHDAGNTITEKDYKLAQDLDLIF